MAKLLKHNSQNGKLISVVLRMTTPGEIKIFRSLLESEPTVRCCRQCGEEIELNRVADMRITIHNPLSGSPLGFPTGDPSFICPHCEREVVIDSMMDITPFTAITKWLSELKIQVLRKGNMRYGYNAKKQEK